MRSALCAALPALALLLTVGCRADLASPDETAGMPDAAFGKGGTTQLRLAAVQLRDAQNYYHGYVGASCVFTFYSSEGPRVATQTWTTNNKGVAKAVATNVTDTGFQVVCTGKSPDARTDDSGFISWVNGGGQTTAELVFE